MFKNLSLAEVLIGFFVVGIFGVGGTSMLMNCSGANKAAAAEEANKWSKEVGIKDANVSCVNSDTDNDGYVSCTIAYRDNNGELKTKAIECAAKLTWNTGCRAPKITINNTQ